MALQMAMMMAMMMMMMMTMTMTMGEMQWEYRTQLRHGFDPRTMATWAVQRIRPVYTRCILQRICRVYTLYFIQQCIMYMQHTSSLGGAGWRFPTRS